MKKQKVNTAPAAPGPVPEAVPAPSMSLDFLDVMQWHRRAAGLAPGAPSYRRYQVIVKELDDAVRLLRMMERSHSPPEVQDFLAKHAGAPYSGDPA